MSLPEEDQIMSEIGLGSHYHWYNGSGSCRSIRITAAERLAAALVRHGYQVDERFTRLLLDVARSRDPEASDDDCCLTTTWQVASEVIRAHISGATNDDTLSYLTNQYNKPQPVQFIDMNGYVLP